MTTDATPALERALVALARAEAPREICGFIRKDPLTDDLVIHPITNLSEKDDQFEMDKVELIDYYKRWIDYNIGVYHSHPEGRREPSDTDIAHAPRGMRYFIVTFDGLHEWEIPEREGDEVKAVKRGQPAA